MNTMRHIILGLTLFLAFPQQTKAEFDGLYIPIAIVGLYGIYELAYSTHELSCEQKRKNDLQESINTKFNGSYVNPIMYFKMLGRTLKTNAEALEKFGKLSESSPLLQQKYLALQAKNMELVQGVSDKLQWVEQLSDEQLQQFALFQKHNFTKKDLDLLVAIRQRNYRDIPREIIDKIEKKYISSQEVQQYVQPV